MKVYLLMRDVEYEGSEVVGAFPTREAAETYNVDRDKWATFDVHEWDVEPERCDDPSPRLRSGLAGTTCALPKGHDGWHRDSDNQQWTLNGNEGGERRVDLAPIRTEAAS